MDVSEIDEIEERDKQAEGRPAAQGILAEAVTRLVHGEEGLQAAVRISEALFSGDISSLTESDFEQLKLDGVPGSQQVFDDVSIVELLVNTELAKSNKMAREFISNGAVSLNGQKVSDTELSVSKESLLFGKFCLLKRGKKLFHLACSA